jgi:hypothetical protein
MTPRNVMHAPVLNRLFPRSKLVHIVRGGPDVAGSLLSLNWKSDVLEALDWWEARVTQAFRATRGLPANRVHVVRFERLTVQDRESALKEILEFLEWDDDAGLRRFFDERMRAENAHVDRWRADFDPSTQETISRHYEAALARLSAQGISLP